MGQQSCVCRNSHSKVINTGHRVQASDYKYFDRLTPAQVSILKAKFPSRDGIDLKGFKNLLPSLRALPERLQQSTFSIFNKDSSGRISWSELCLGVSKFLVGTPADQAEFLFLLFDTRKKGSLSSKGIKQLLTFLTPFLKSNDLFVTRKLNAHAYLTKEEFVAWACEHVRTDEAMESFELIPSRQTERRTIGKLMHNDLVEGEVWNVISKTWLEAWRSYVNSEDSLHQHRPIEIDNSAFAYPECRVSLQKPLEGFELVPNEAWRALHSWYGGGPEFSRTVINEAGKCYVELYPPVLTVRTASSNQRTLCISKKRKVKEVVEKMLDNATAETDISEYRIYMVEDGNFTHLEGNLTLESAGLGEGGALVMIKDGSEPSHECSFIAGEAVEVKEEGNWLPYEVVQCTTLEYKLRALWNDRITIVPKERSFKIRKPQRPFLSASQAGCLQVKGILNIGNTCYAGAILQCLASTPLLSHYLAEGDFFGLNGEVSSLIKSLRDGEGVHISPRNFLARFRKKNSQFVVNEQQDSHEFLRILLDNLHEERSSMELHKTVSLLRPSIALEHEESSKQWDNSHCSVVADFCRGQTRTSLTCPACGDFKVIFETFMDLSLPIPLKEPEIILSIVYVPKASETIKKMRILANTEPSLSDLLSRLEQVTEISKSRMVFAHVSRHSIKRVCLQPETLEDILPFDDDEIYLYDSSEPAWKEVLEVGDFIDVCYEDTWTVGKVLELEESSIKVKVYTAELQTVSYTSESPLLAPYRLHTSCPHELTHIPISMNSADVGRAFGVPLLVSVHSQATLSELHRKLVDELKLFTYKSASKAYKIYVVFQQTGQCAFCNTVLCGGCPLNPRSKEPLPGSPISVQVDWKHSQYYAFPFRAKVNLVDDLDLHECLDEFVKAEMIEMTCEKCQHKEMERQTQILRVPDILIIHLKRFYFKKGSMRKIKNLVQFSLKDLGISELMLSQDKEYGITVESARENFSYELYAVLNHSGNAQRGHYTASCSTTEGAWIEYDDERMYETPPADVVTPKAYMLFYKRKRFASRNVVNMTVYTSTTKYK